MSQELKTLNAIPEFRTDAQIAEIIHYKNTGNFPAGLNQRQQNRYQQKFQNFIVQHGLLKYVPNPNPNNISLIVCLNANKNIVLQNIFDNIRRGLGTGLGSFYHQVCATHLNIKKRESDAFLRSQSNYQVLRILKRPRINKPIESSTPNDRWGVDMIDMSTSPQNNMRRWILVCVDYFSGYIMARSMTNKRMPTVRTNMEAMFNANNTFPSKIQCDGEFDNNEIREMCNANGIQFIKTSPYTPTSNGMVERANREVRKVIRSGFVRNNSFQWSPFLSAYIENINSQRRAGSKQTRESLWSQGFNPLPAGHVQHIGRLNDSNTLQERQDINKGYLDEKTQKMLSTGAIARRFQVNDNVRIRLENMSTPARERRKSEFGLNLNAIHWTPEIYTVTHVRQPAGIRPPEYNVSDNAGNILQSGATPRTFFGSDLLFVPPVNVQTTVNPRTIQRANRINRLRN